jgi:Secretory lipase
MLLSAVALVALAVCGTTAIAANRATLPDDDPFYAAPAKHRLKGARPGRVLRSREVDLSASNIAVPHRAWQLLYRTADTTGRPEAAVATLIVPDVPVAGRRPLLSYQPAEDSLTRRCASSYELRNGSGGEPDTFDMGLERGWAVVVPDYEGPESQWVAGVQAGHAVLDAVRAAERFRAGGLDGRKTPVGIWGYSGGGHATAWAAELQPRYAPELRVRGIAHGGAPGDLVLTARSNDGGPASGLILAAAVGISRAYPQMGLDELLNDAGREMVSRIGDMCLEEFLVAYPLRRMNEFTVVPDPLAVPSVARVIQRLSPARRKPSAPLHVYHAIADEVNPISASDAMVERYCALGATVDYERTPAGEHIAVAETGAPGAVAYLADRFAGAPAPNDC